MNALRWLLLVLGLACWARGRKIYVFIGQVGESMDVYKVYVYPDYNYGETFIFQRDFDCTEAKRCHFEPEPKTMVYRGHTLTYYDAYTPMNMLPQAFSRPVHFRYVLDGNSRLPSIVGFHKSSEFLAYLAAQDAEKGRNLIFKLDWEHNMLIKGEIIRTDKLPVDMAVTGQLILTARNQLKTTDLKVCFTNMLDVLDPAPSMLGVRADQFENWRAFVTETMGVVEMKGNTLLFNIFIYLFDPNKSPIGHMEFKIDEFMAENERLLIKPFDDAFDEGRGCDLYTGSLLLKKHSFEYFYREVANGKFEALWSYDAFHGYKEDSRIRKKSHFESDMYLFTAIFIVAGYLVYQNLLKRKASSPFDPEDPHHDDDADHYDQPIELEETSKGKSALPAKIKQFDQ